MQSLLLILFNWMLPDRKANSSSSSSGRRVRRVVESTDMFEEYFFLYFLVLRPTTYALYYTEDRCWQVIWNTRAPHYVNQGPCMGVPANSPSTKGSARRNNYNNNMRTTCAPHKGHGPRTCVQHITTRVIWYTFISVYRVISGRQYKILLCTFTRYTYTTFIFIFIFFFNTSTYHSTIIL